MAGLRLTLLAVVMPFCVVPIQSALCQSPNSSNTNDTSATSVPPVRIGQLLIQTEGETKIIVEGWPRHSNLSVQSSQCDLKATVTSAGQVKLSGKYFIPLDVSGTGAMRATSPVADAVGCHWVFENDVPFEVAGARVTPSKGATLDYAKAGVVTRGVEFQNK